MLAALEFPAFWADFFRHLIIHQLLQPLTTNCKTHLSIIRTARSPLSLVNWVGQGWEENGWVVGLWDVRYAYSAHCTLSASLCLSVMPRHTQCEPSIFIWKEGTDLQLPTHTLKRWRASLNIRPVSYRIRKYTALLDEMRDDSVISHLDRYWVKLLSMQVSRCHHCPNFLSVIFFLFRVLRICHS